LAIAIGSQAKNKIRNTDASRPNLDEFIVYRFEIAPHPSQNQGAKSGVLLAAKFAASFLNPNFKGRWALVQERC
jgi:hypothetical protein